jgi:hypothetical protein
MCNYFGSSCSGPTDTEEERYREQAQREYNAMVANAQWNRQLPSLYGLAAAPDPRARKGEIQAEARSRRWDWLTQDNIDGGNPMKYNDEIHWYGCGCKRCNPPRRSLRQWLGGVPKGWSTLIVLLVVGLVLWALVCVPDFVDVVSTAGRG